MSVNVTTSSGNTIDVSVNGSNTVSLTQTSTSLSVSTPTVSTITVTEKGPKGDTGATGATGATGSTGATGAEGPTYSVSCVDGDNSDEEKIRLTGSDSSTDDVVLEAGTGLSIARSSDKITFANTVTDTNTQNTTTLSFVDSSDDILLRNTTGGAGSGTDDIKFVAGTNVTLTHTDADNITIASADTNTQLSTEQVQDIAGPLVATGGTKTNIAVTYDDTNGNMDFVVASDLNTTGTAGGLSSTLAVGSGGTGLTTVASNTILTGNGTSALTSQANLQFGNSRLTIGDNSEDIQPYIRMLNDENTLEFGIANGTSDFVPGSVDGDVVLNSFGDHNVIIAQSDVAALTIDTNGDSNFNRRFTVTGDTDGTYEGDVVYFGGTTSMTTGALYHYKSDGTWELADADAVATCDGLLAIALGAASDTNGMLLRGMVTVDHDTGAVGDVLFVSTTAGDITATAPSGNNDIVRVVGYCLHASNGQIWFNPDGAFVEVTA